MKRTIPAAVLAALLMFTTAAPAYASGGSGGGSGSGGSTTTTTSTSGGTNSGGVKDTTTGGGGKTICDPIQFFTADAGYRPGAMGITATFTPALCVSGKNYNQFVITNLTTGVVEYQTFSGNTANSIVWDLPAFDTDYRVDMSVIRTKDNVNLGTKSITVRTPVMVANCASITNYNLSAGYWINYAAIWTAYTVKDCGYGRETITMRVTNLSTGSVESTYVGLPTSTMVDFEGPIVSYDTDYQIEVEVRGAQNELLDSHSEVTHTPIAK